jgi:aryl-alcohol dehydrogenase-like predicted oxidoreductase
VSTLYEIVNPATDEHHHCCLKMTTIDRSKAKGWNIKPDKSVQPIASWTGLALAQLPVAWVVAQPGVTAAIAGARSPARVRENAAAASATIAATQRKEIDAALACGMPR